MWRKLGSRIHSGKYLKSIYLWISLFFIALQVAFSAAILVQTNQQEMKSNYEMNAQIFHQVAYNVEQSDAIIRSLCKSLFVNPKITRMMYSTMQEDDVYEWIQEFQSVCDPILLSNPQVQSIYVYNREMDHLFSSYRYLNFQDDGIRDMLNTDGGVSLLKPTVRMIDSPEGKSKSTKVITYVLYDAMDQTGKPDGAIIVNVDFNKFSDEIRQLITFSEEEKSKVLIFDENREIAFDRRGQEMDEAVEQEVQRMLDDLQIPSGENFILRTEKIMGGKYGIFFTNVSSMDWVIVKIQSYEEVFRSVNRQKMMIMAMSVTFCTLMLGLTYILARKIYSPIGQLVQKVREERPEEDAGVNDIQYLNRAYENLFQKSRDYQKKGAQSRIILAYNLRSLLIDGKETDEKVLGTLQAVDGALFVRDHKFGVGILQIDNYSRFREKYDHKDQELYKYAIENILSEVLLSSGYRNVIIPVDGDKMAVIMHGDPEGEEAYCEDMKYCFHTANENVKKYFHITFTVSVSAYEEGIGRIHELYREAERQLPYRYILGKEAVILYDYEVQQADDKEVSSVMEHMDRHIQAGNEREIRGDFEHLAQIARCQRSECLIEFLTSRVVQILHLIDTRERTNNNYAGTVFLERYTEILSLETWEEMSLRLEKLLAHAAAPEDRQVQKTNLLVGTIQKVVREEFEDPNLCVQQIADMVKMSSQYVGRVFRANTGISVAEYINEYRLKKSIEIMMATGCTVSEVLAKVGMENESQYYRLFKKKYGTTPKAYMLDRLAGEIMQEPRN